jgi:flagellar hook-length control protein FliK
LAAPVDFAPGSIVAHALDPPDPRIADIPGPSDPTVSAPTASPVKGQGERSRPNGDRLLVGTGDKATENTLAPTVSVLESGQPGVVAAALALVPPSFVVPSNQVASTPLPATVSDRGHLTRAKPREIAGQHTDNSPLVAQTSQRTVHPMRPGEGTALDNPRAVNPTDEARSANQLRMSGQSELISTMARSEGPDDIALAAEPRQSESVASPGLASTTSTSQTAHEQLASALVGFAGSSDGTQTVTVRLQPPELGQVVVRVDRSVEGSAHVNFAAEKPDTLQLLLHDEPRLQQLLDQAGIPGNGRTVSFQTTIADQSGSGTSRAENMTTGSDGSGHNHGSGAWRDNGHARQNSGGDTDSGQEHSRFRWMRFGLDITA